MAKDMLEIYPSQRREAILDLKPEQLAAFADGVDVVIVRAVVNIEGHRPRTYSMRIPAHALAPGYRLPDML